MRTGGLRRRRAEYIIRSLEHILDMINVAEQPLSPSIIRELDADFEILKTSFESALNNGQINNEQEFDIIDLIQAISARLPDLATLPQPGVVGQQPGVVGQQPGLAGQGRGGSFVQPVNRKFLPFF
jgi:uncharacterized membrane protein YccC